jgi:DNA helicase-2/ATP-dependent DNA helicase PcrA
MEEGIFPHSVSSRDEHGLEEERRLCYVGMTRAKEELTLSCAAQRLRFGSRSSGLPSRFLSEIPDSVLARREPLGRVAGGHREPGGPSLDYSYSQVESGEGSGLGPGLRVRHPIFGPGTVLAVAGDGPGQKLRIRFDRAGVKTVMLRYANLELG